MLPPHPLPVHPHPGIAHVKDDPELLHISSRHTPVLGSTKQLRRVPAAPHGSRWRDGTSGRRDS
jgi:hypothetical protein